MKLINFRQIEGGVALLDKVKKLSALSTYDAILINAVKQSLFPIKEKADLSTFADPKSPATEFVLHNEPNSQEVEMFINGILYEENDSFTVNRKDSKITWTFTEANKGFDLYNEISDFITIKYFTNIHVDKTLRHKVIFEDKIPAEGTFNEGDIVLRSRADAEGKIGWIYKKTETVSETGETVESFDWIEIDVFFLEQLVEEASKIVEKEEPPYLTFEDDEYEFTIEATKTWDGILEYSFDTENWTEWNGEKITSVNGKIYMRGEGNTVISDDIPFVITEIKE